MTASHGEARLYRSGACRLVRQELRPAADDQRLPDGQACGSQEREPDPWTNRQHTPVIRQVVFESGRSCTA